MARATASFEGLRLLSYCQYKLARYQDALAAADERFRIASKALGENSLETISALRDLAVAYQNAGPDGYAGPCRF